MIVYLILLAIVAFLAYTSGSISTQRLASRYLFKRNLRRLGDGDVWISNFRRLFGVVGFLKLLGLEIVKALVPILLGGLLLRIKGHADVGFVFAGFCLMMGRLFPVFNRFRGCHGVVALCVAALFSSPSVGIAAAILTAAVIWFTRYLSLGALVAAVAVIVIAILVVDSRILLLLTIGTALLVIVRHIPAIRRLTKGEEPRLNFVEDLSYKFDEKF